MKKLKKLFALMLAMMMLLAMGSTAMASGEPPAQPTTGSITIKDSEEGTTYKLYKIFGLSGQDGAFDTVTYSMTDDWRNFFATEVDDAEPPQKFILDENTSNLNPIVIGADTKYINITDSNIAAFTRKALQYAGRFLTENRSVSGDGNDIVVSGLELGYYLIFPEDAAMLTTNSGTVASITSTTPNANVTVKAVKPDIEKTDDTVSADIGTEVKYIVKGILPNPVGYSYKYQYKIIDNMSDGLTFKKNVVLKIDGNVVPFAEGTEFTINYGTNGFEVDIDVFTMSPGHPYLGKEFTLEYSAIVNEKAVKDSGAAEKNSVKLIYGNNVETVEKKEEVYSSKITVNKEVTGTDTKLAGAKFVLMNIEGKYYKYTAATDETPASVSWVTVADAPANGTGNVSDADATVIKNAVTNGIITGYETDGTGKAVFNGLADGTYYLVEYEAPTGYNRLESPQVAILAGSDVDTATGKVENKADSTNKFDNANNVEITVDNNKGGLLPGTGSIGTTIFYVIGGAMVVVAGVVLVTRKRMNVEK